MKGKIEMMHWTKPNCRSPFNKAQLHDLRNGTTVREIFLIRQQNNQKSTVNIFI